jgi:hypothetical protein
MRKIYTVIVGLMLASSVFAQVPEKMSYQAVVRDAGDNLTTNQAVGMQISILQGGVAGLAVYVETQTPSTNANGLVSLEIGTGTVVNGDFTTIDWANDTYFIKTETDPTGGTTYTITGTSQLMSVPYALHSKTAENVMNDLVNDADADPTNEMNTGIVLNGSDLELTDGNGTITTDLSSLSNWTATGNHIYNNNTGNVGIGTPNPSSTLEIMPIGGIGATTLLNAGNLSSSVAHQFRAYRSSGNQHSEGEIRLYNTNKFVFSSGFNINSEVMTIELSTGNVGIGQTNTAYTSINSKFQVKGGDVYIEDIANGIIMKSPNGQCWKTTVDNSGSLITTLISCP